MTSKTHNKHKIINDPVYGFIKIPSDLIYEIIEHPYFQRLRSIKQLGLTFYVYPGAVHTRFQHVLGAMHLMGTAIEVLKAKGVEITDQEAEAVTAAILLHDIGHGPFSHTLEHSIVEGISHEEISILFMKELNKLFEGRLTMAIEIFTNKYPKKFLYSLVSGQLDMDRTDYLRRDSFFTGVAEGAVGTERLIKMLDVVNDELTVEAKGIYSVEKFLIARRLMYWQVYLHKTVIASEQLLTKIMLRARFVAQSGTELFGSPQLLFFLKNNITKISQLTLLLPNHQFTALEYFAELDDNDILCAIKVWKKHTDKVLAVLCNDLINRNFPVLEMRTCPYSEIEINAYRQNIADTLNLSASDAEYFVYSDYVSNSAYSMRDYNIRIKNADGSIVDIAEASDIANISALSKKVTKYFLCFPKVLRT
ncbi:MAG TPA: phosphohydrolase [Bacteroidales bacterium]|nr:phosphohydrolase [Bacteroidales bacterium]